MSQRPRGRALVIVALAWLIASTGWGAAAVNTAGAPVNEETVREIAARLRCVVCQNLSVADSPSETANQMRGIIRERLAAGDSPDQVLAYFVEKYGIWILLAPPRHGFTLLVWVLPFVALAGGLLIVGVVVRRWMRRPRSATGPLIDESMRQRIRRELAELDHE